ncbi:MAG: glycosyltransferase family 2 protein [Flavobacteriales bacterium]
MKISVIIPCRNEKNYIEECITAIFQCELPSGCELQVYVVDGMSDDGTRDVIEELGRENSKLSLVDNQKQLTPFAFNLGIHAGGKVDYVQIVGARHILSKNYLMECIKSIQQNKDIWCAGGKIINAAINPISERIAAVMSSAFGMGMGNFRTLEQSGFTDTVTSPMYPYEVFEKIGFFDENLIRNQDDDFNFRVTQAGGKIFFIHDISLKYYVRASIAGVRKQFFQYGYWKVFVNQKHGVMTTIRQLFPPLFVLYLLSFPFIYFFPNWLKVLSLLPIQLYVIGLIFFTLRLTGLKNFLQTAFLFPLIHLSYGSGYLLGIMDFILLKKNPSDKQKELSR